MNGYLIPENAQPADTRCLRVFVPDDPLYIAAFLGALTYFGQWTAWERDEQKRGQFAAHAWREANELTLDGLSLPCGDYPITDEEMSEILEQLADIRSQLAEINNMNVTQTVNVGGCGCGDGSTSTTTTGTIIDPEDTGIIPPYMTDEIQASAGVRCRAANHLSRMVSETIRALAGRLGGGVLLIVGIAQVLFSILTWIDLVPGDEVVGSVIGILGLITIAQAIARMAGTTVFTWGVLDELAEILESPTVAQEFVCALYGGSNAEELGNALTSFLNSKISQLNTDEFVKNAMIDVFHLLFDPRIINWYVENIDSIVPADFIPAYSCLCGATGDSCPTQNIVLAGVGSFPTLVGGLEGTTQGFASQFNGQTGYYEIIFELADNYCVTIENGAYTPTENNEKCASGVMVPSDGSCIRRFVASSLEPFATAVTFNQVSNNCDCNDFVEWLVGAGVGRDGCGATNYPIPECYEDYQKIKKNDDGGGDYYVQYRLSDIGKTGVNNPEDIFLNFDDIALSPEILVEVFVDGGIATIMNGTVWSDVGYLRIDISGYSSFGGGPVFDLKITNLTNNDTIQIEDWHVTV